MKERGHRMLGWFHKLLPQRGKILRSVRAAFRSRGGRRRSVARAARRRRGRAAALQDHHGSRAGRRQHHARGADRGAAHLHHAVRPRRHQGPDHLDGQRHRPDAEDRQGRDAVRSARRSRPACARWAMRSCNAPRLVREAMPLPEVDQHRGDAAERDHRGDFGTRRQGRRTARHGLRDSFWRACKAPR